MNLVCPFPGEKGSMMSIPQMANDHGEVMLCSSSGLVWWRGSNSWYLVHFFTYSAQSPSMVG